MYFSTSDLGTHFTKALVQYVKLGNYYISYKF